MLLSARMTLALSQSIMCFSLLQWSLMANFKFVCSAFSFISHVCLPVVSFPHSISTLQFCCFFHVLNALPVSPLYVILHDLQGIFVYNFILFLNFVLGFTSMCLSLLFGFTVWVFASCFPQGRLYPFVEPLPCQITLWNYQLLFCAWLLCCHLRPSWWFVLWVFGLVLF